MKPHPAPVAIRPARPQDDDDLWAMLAPVFRAGETYMIERDISREAALDFWCGGDHLAFLAEAEVPLGTYYLCPNRRGPGAHVCNAGFITARGAEGRGVARAMLDHALVSARGAGFHAMQFNAVLTSNARALALWLRAGFEEVGRIPEAYRLPDGSLTEAAILWRRL